MTPSYVRHLRQMPAREMLETLREEPYLRSVLNGCRTEQLLDLLALLGIPEPPMHGNETPEKARTRARKLLAGLVLGALQAEDVERFTPDILRAKMVELKEELRRRGIDPTTHRRIGEPA